MAPNSNVRISLFYNCPAPNGLMPSKRRLREFLVSIAIFSLYRTKKVSSSLDESCSPTAGLCTNKKANSPPLFFSSLELPRKGERNWFSSSHFHFPLMKACSEKKVNCIEMSSDSNLCICYYFCRGSFSFLPCIWVECACVCACRYPHTHTHTAYVVVVGINI